MNSLKKYGAVFFLFFISCKSYLPPEYKEVKNFKVLNAGKDTSVVHLDILFFNPNKKKFKLKDAELDVYFDNKFIGHTHLDSTIQIPANAEFMVPVKMKVPMKEFLSKAATLFLKEEVLLHLVGKVKINASGFNKKIDVDFTGPQKLDFAK